MVRMTRAAVYARISQDRTGEAVNVGEQRERCIARCAERGWQVVAIHEDNNRSAFRKGGKRPAFSDLMADVIGGRVDVVVVDRLDRLTRDPGDDWAVQTALGEAGAVLEVVSGAGTLDPAKVDDRLLQGINALVGWRESAEKAKRLRLKEAAKAQAGDHHGRRGFGHNHDRSDVIPAEADLIREATTRVLAGESVPSIVRDWTDRGVTTAGQGGGCPCDECKPSPREGFGGRWYPTTLTQVLRQPRLMGARSHNGTITKADAFAPIIDPDTFERLQAALDRRPGGNRNARRPRNRVLGGFVRCGKCGSMMRSGFGGHAADGKRPPRFACPTKAEGGCGSMAVFDHNAEPVVLEALFAYLCSPEFAAALERQQAAASSVDLDATAADLRAARARLVELGDMLADGDLDRDTYKRQQQRITERIAALESALATVSPAAPVAALDADDLRERWGVMTFTERRTVLEAVLDRVIVNPAEKRGGPFEPGRLDVRFRWAD